MLDAIGIASSDIIAFIVEKTGYDGSFSQETQSIIGVPKAKLRLPEFTFQSA